jgi:hypothetical protein
VKKKTPTAELSTEDLARGYAVTMIETHAFHGAATDLAAGSVGTGVVAFVIGLVVVLVLIGGFYLGFRRRAHSTAPTGPSDRPRTLDRRTHVEDTSESCDVFPDDGSRLLPHELGGHGHDLTRSGQAESAAGKGGRDRTEGAAGPRS